MLSALPANAPDLADAKIRRRIEVAVLELLADASPSARKAA